MVINFSRNPHQQNSGFLKLLFQFSLISSFHLFEEYYTKVFLHTGLSRYWKGLQAVGGGHRGESQLSRQNWCPQHFQITVINIPFQKQNKTNATGGRVNCLDKIGAPNIFTFQITVVNIPFKKT